MLAWPTDNMLPLTVRKKAVSAFQQCQNPFYRSVSFFYTAVNFIKGKIAENS